MTEMLCNYGDDRDGAIVAFLYDDPDGSGAERARFGTHLPTCAHCQADIAALRGVREQLARWAPPEPSFAVVSHQSSVLSPRSSVAGPRSSVPNPQSGLREPQAALSLSKGAIRNPQWWRPVPVWAQVAAALLFLGVSAGLANLDVRYDQRGLSIRTGWSQEAGRSGGSEVAQPPSQGFGEPRRSSQGQQASGGGGSSPVNDAPWKTDLTALESQLKNEIRATRASATAAAALSVRPVPVSASDADVTRRVRALVEESEKRQQRELALRIAELLRDVNVQRQADLVKIDRTLGVVQNNVGIEVMKNRQQINQMDLLYRASQRQ